MSSYLVGIRAIVNTKVHCDDSKMARPGGNPDFGKKYSFVTKGSEPLSKKQFQIRLPETVHEELMTLERQERLALVREAISSALLKRKQKLSRTK